MKFLFKQKLAIVSVIAIILITTGAKCERLPENVTYGKPKPVTLQYWKVYEDSFNIEEFLSNYQKVHPHISVQYRSFRADEYENELLKAFAEDRGPDIFSIHTTWLRKYQNLILPMPEEIKIDYQILRGTIKKEIFTETRTQPTLTLRDIKTLFPDVVYDNQIIKDKIYGLPLSIDSLALFYNRDLLNNAGIASPPKNWDQFRDDVIKLVRVDTKGNILQAGAAIGTANNIERSTDLLSLLMMQAGALMTNAEGYATFNQVPAGYTRGIRPATEALNFYTSFASPATQVYTWNETMPNSLQAFMAGQTAFFFGYAYHISLIKAQAPKLNFEVAQMPQVSDQPINYANYWVETVSQKSKHPDEAWDFIIYITTNKEVNKKYLDKAKKPCALRSLIVEQQKDLYLEPFASQLLTASSWYKGKDVVAAEKILKSMISDNLEGVLNTNQIIDLGVSKINQTIR